MTATTHDPSRMHYVPYYDNDAQECERLERCLQQQVEDCFMTMSRIRDITDDRRRWETLRAGLRCWRAAIRSL